MIKFVFGFSFNESVDRLKLGNHLCTHFMNKAWVTMQKKKAYYAIALYLSNIDTKNLGDYVIKF